MLTVLKMNHTEKLLNDVSCFLYCENNEKPRCDLLFIALRRGKGNSALELQDAASYGE